MKIDPTPRAGPGASRELVVLLTAAVLVAAFAAMRFGGLWGEADTSVFARSIRAVLADGSLVPSRYAYAHGYGYPALVASLSRITGLSVGQLQIFGGALLMVWIVLPAWLAYRALTGSARGATLATALILVQPEFLFPLLRGSHEKFTRGLMFLAFYLLVRGLLARRRWRRFASLLLAFYLVVYALITFNSLMAISFITALGLALALNLAVRQLTGAGDDDTAATRRRLIYAIGISLILAFFFIFYAYLPARNSILAIQSTTDQVATLFLEAGEAVNPYGTVNTAWVSLPVYLMVSIANWLLLAFSFVLWLGQTVMWLRRRTWPEEPRALLLWSLYGAFGFLGALSILADVSGALSANLQHRVFPSFAMIAAPYVADWFVRRQAGGPETRRRGRDALVYGALASTIAFLSIVAVIKATNEPSLSNKWGFYTPAEFTSLEWARDIDPDTVMWTEFDERVHAALMVCCERLTGEGRYRPYDITIRNYLISDVTRARGERMNLPLPIEGDSLLIYDNGAAEIYRLRPRTPFQK
jgi:hypothetical protein